MIFIRRELFRLNIPVLWNLFKTGHPFQGVVIDNPIIDIAIDIKYIQIREVESSLVGLPDFKSGVS